MKRGMGLTDAELHDVYEEWNNMEPRGYLLEITANIFAKIDEQTGKPLIDVILDVAKQMGTGKWTAQEAMDLRLPVPTIAAAVGMRDLSLFTAEREDASRLLPGPSPTITVDRAGLITQLRNAFFAGMIDSYAQGFALLGAGSKAHSYHLALAEVARIWQGGCIIRAEVLERIRIVFSANTELPSLLLDHGFAQELAARQADLRIIVRAAVTHGIPLPGFMSVLGYYDAYRSAWLPANLIQAQRDYFGAHTYERVDEKGNFHTRWE